MLIFGKLYGERAINVQHYCVTWDYGVTDRKPSLVAVSQHCYLTIVIELHKQNQNNLKVDECHKHVLSNWIKQFQGC